MEEYVYLFITEYFHDGLEDVQVFKDLEDAIAFLQYNYSVCDYTMDTMDSDINIDDLYCDVFMCNITKEIMTIYIYKKKILQ